MSGKTSIEWATVSWNPTVGCTRASDGCTNCYAYTLHDRMRYAPNVRRARAAGYRTPVEARAAARSMNQGERWCGPISKALVLAYCSETRTKPGGCACEASDPRRVEVLVPPEHTHL